MAEAYEKYKIKDYKYWTMFLHVNQYPYIWRCYAWAKRENADLTTDMTKEERDELFDEVIPSWSNCVKGLFSNDRINVSSLGNTSNHLHWHMIPRYFAPREFDWIKFLDANPNANYAPYEKKELNEDILQKIKQALKSKLVTYNL
ncbi:MAG: hypothetical protein ACD_3C00128G0003 [uncultured bacterium (gcode 4)]|uniref:HIT domain-containing protein n=1 Tax=uncultured bacterium (gcode 4) TaxID=1234023 RepID=K2G141_9BACT|nr:MAG: hypothetical protein ACD_3C00128G0003 [uncultured bacterium (gcode 4)]